MHALKFKVPLWPVGPALAIAFMMFVIGVLGYMEDTRVALYVGAGWVALVSAAWYLRVKPTATGALAEDASGV